MSEHKLSHPICGAVLLGLASVRPATAAPLEEFLQAARQRSAQAQISRAELAAAEASLTRARAALLPNLSLSAGYTRNQYEVEVTLPGAPGSGGTSVVVTPQDQVDATFTARVPLFDGRTYARAQGAAAGLQAAAARDQAAVEDVLLGVLRAYYEAVSAAGVEEAAQRALEAARATERRLAERVEAGRATSLQLRRAQADTARARQSLATAASARAAAARTLATLSGLDQPPSPVGPPSAPRPDLSALVAHALERRADVAAARADRDAARASAREARWAYMPVLAAQASERLSNATGFAGRQATWQASVVLTWNVFDSFGREAGVREADARVVQAEARLVDRVRRTRDDVANAVDRLRAAEQSLLAARGERDAAVEAARLAREAVEAGTATPVELTVAERDSFSAEVSLARAEADLAVAAAEVRHASGEPIGGAP
jgi:outer membrane protein